MGPALEPTEVTGHAAPSWQPGEGLAGPVGALMSGMPLSVQPDASVAVTARAMRDAGASSAIVAGPEPGIVTDSDLRRRVLAEERPTSTPIDAVTSRPLRTLRADAPVYEALQLMLDEDVHHVPVTRDGQIVGLLTDEDLLRLQAPSPLLLLGRIHSLDTLDALGGYAEELAATAAGLRAGGLEAVGIARVIASLNDQLAAKLLRLAEDELGPPPCPYAWLALGSEGRMEQLLLSDQDNALAYRDDTPEATSYFAALAERAVAGLLVAGLPPCPGGYMATRWCRSLSAWDATFRAWIDRPTAEALLEAQIIFDLRPVHGELPVGRLQELLLSGGRNARFLMHMAKVAQRFPPPIGLFGRMRLEDDAFDVKLGGIQPVVILGRLAAVAAGSPAPSTRERLQAGGATGGMSLGHSEALIEAFHFLMGLRLRTELHAMAAGGAPSNTLPLTSLTSLEKRRLREHLRSIALAQKAVGQRYHTELVR